LCLAKYDRWIEIYCAVVSRTSIYIFSSFPNDNNLKSKEQNKKDKNFTSTKWASFVIPTMPDDELVMSQAVLEILLKFRIPFSTFRNKKMYII